MGMFFSKLTQTGDIHNYPTLDVNPTFALTVDHNHNSYTWAVLNLSTNTSAKSLLPMMQEITSNAQ